MSRGKALSPGCRIWVVGDAFRNFDGLVALHKAVRDMYRPGDVMLYTGGIFGGKSSVLEKIDEILLFRRTVMAAFETPPEDICFLKGVSEAMLFKLFQLNLTHNALLKYDAMVAQGLGGTIAAYGLGVEEGRAAVGQGAVATYRFIEALRSRIKEHDSHYEFLFSEAFFDYAFTENHSALFVSSGLDQSKRLPEQKDEFSMFSGVFDTVGKYDDFSLVVRGRAYEIFEDGIFVDPHYISINPIDHAYAMLLDAEMKPLLSVKI